MSRRRALRRRRFVAPLGAAPVRPTGRKVRAPQRQPKIGPDSPFDPGMRSAAQRPRRDKSEYRARTACWWPSLDPVPDRPDGVPPSMISLRAMDQGKALVDHPPSSRSRTMKPSMFQSELSTPDDSGQRPLT